MYILPGALAPLGNYRQFILVQLIQAVDVRGQAVAGKTIKHPMNPWSLLRHSAHDPAIWMDCDSAARLAANTPIAPRTIGWCVGFVITENDPIICNDLDNCALPDGTWNADAQEMMRRFPAAIELSLSGRGLHQWGFYTGKCPPHGKRNGKRNMELYSELRFIALGHSATGTMYDLTALLPAFIEEFFPYSDDVENGEGWTSAPVPEHTVLTDDELIHKAMSRTRERSAAATFSDAPALPCFRDLWTRDVSVLARVYPPQMPGKDIDGSSADIALAKELAYWTGKDCERIHRLMQQSALRRDKWDTRRKDTTYLHETVLTGVAFCSAVYSERPILPQVDAATAHAIASIVNKMEPTLIVHQTFVGRENLAAIFAGCVYIQDVNAVLLPNGDVVDQARFNAKFAGYTYGMDNENIKTSKSAWEAFLGNQIIAFPRAEGTVFDPALVFQSVVERAGRSWVNIYKEPVVGRRPGDVKPFMDLLHKLLPNGDDALILLSYMAAVVQYRGVKFRWAPFIQGTQGNGKSTIVACLKHALGHKYIFSVKAGMIENGFNAWLENNVLYVADDIYSAKDRTDMMEALKSLITETEHAITLKGIDSIQKIICGNFIFTDNHKDAMKKQDDTRRICTLYCAQQSKWDRQRDGLTKAFFANEFIPWLKNGGYAHVAELLHTMPIDPRYNPAGECQEAPETSVTREAVIDGRTGIEHEVAEWVELGEPGFCGDFISHHMLKAKMMANQQYAKSASPLKIKEMMNRLGYELHRALPEGRTPTFVQPDDTRPLLYVKRDAWQANLDDAASVTALYVQAQQEAITAQVARRFNQGV